MSSEATLQTIQGLRAESPVDFRMGPGPLPDGLERVRVFGIPFARISQEGLVDEIERMIHTGGNHWIVTANVQHVTLASRNASFRDTLLSADLAVADGAPICWASRRGHRLALERVTGADLVMPLARRCRERGWRMFLMGGADGVAERLRAYLERELPGIEIAGAIAPRVQSLESLLDGDADGAIDAIRAARPEVLLLALGTPKQELWIAHCLGRLEVPVSVGVGAAFDFLVGEQRRAPVWVQRMGMEWLHRMAHEPRRLGPRYLRSGMTLMRLAARELAVRNP